MERKGIPPKDLRSPAEGQSPGQSENIRLTVAFAESYELIVSLIPGLIRRVVLSIDLRLMLMHWPFFSSLIAKQKKEEES